MPLRPELLPRRWRQQFARRRGARRDRLDERGQRRQWFLLTGRRPRLDPAQLDVAGLTPLYPPLDQFWADPFVWRRDGQSCCFFEARAYRIKRGHIRAWPLDPDGRPIGESFPVIDRPHHLSYPFVLEHEGGLYMIPESAETGRVELYGCVRFPDRWELIRPLIQGRRLSDCTLLRHDGRWWLFCAGSQGRSRVNETLLAFHADDPLGERWIPHAGNPILRDFGGARPAGRIQQDAAGRLLRPAQDCIRRYGYGLSLNRITALSPERYAEQRIWYGNGPAIGGWRGLHHLDWHDGLLVMDAQRLIPAGTDPGPPARGRRTA
jgi:hypothetical protein